MCNCNKILYGRWTHTQHKSIESKCDAHMGRRQQRIRLAAFSSMWLSFLCAMKMKINRVTSLKRIWVHEREKKLYNWLIFAVAAARAMASPYVFFSRIVIITLFFYSRQLFSLSGRQFAMRCNSTIYEKPQSSNENKRNFAVLWQKQSHCFRAILLSSVNLCTDRAMYMHWTSLTRCNSVNAE